MAARELRVLFGRRNEKKPRPDKRAVYVQLCRATSISPDAYMKSESMPIRHF